MGHVYPAEFKTQIVELYRHGDRTFMELGKEFDLSPTTVANWVRQASVDEGRAPGLTSAEKAEITSLRRQLRHKDEELEILGKALAFFARRSDL
jgi:transposase